MRGQTSLEYMLLFAFVAIITISVMKRIQEYMVGDRPCPNPSLGCSLVRAMEGDLLNRENRYKYFILRR